MDSQDTRPDQPQQPAAPARSTSRSHTTPSAYLILDWNGTVVDDIHRAHASTLAALAPTSITTDHLSSVAEFQAQFTLPLPRFFANQGVPPPQIDQILHRWNHEMSTRPTTLAPGARALLTRARELNLAIHIVSGAHADTVRADATSLAVQPLIDSITGDAHPKRDTVISLRHTPQPLIYVGDTEYDITEATSAGAITIGTSYGYRPAHALHHAGAHLIIDHLARLIPVIEALTSPGIEQGGTVRLTGPLSESKRRPERNRVGDHGPSGRPGRTGGV